MLNSGDYNWQVSSGWLAASNYEITPSTASGGTTFNTPALKIAGSTGNATFSSDVHLDIASGAAKLTVDSGSAGAETSVYYTQNGADRWRSYVDSNQDYGIYNYGTSTESFNIDAATDAVTFAGGATFAGNVGWNSGEVVIYTSSTLEWDTADASLTMQSFKYSGSTVGTITRNTSATSFNTSSDPRLKSGFTPFDPIEAWAAFDGIYSASGKFNFLADPAKVVWGFDAHKLVDLNIGLGTEGQGSREAKLQSVYDTELVSEAVEAVDEVLGDDGEVVVNAVEAKEAVYRDLEVTPAGVDQSKMVPYLLAVIKDLKDRVEALEA
jgi:hypothetical protein